MAGTNPATRVEPIDVSAEDAVYTKGDAPRGLCVGTAGEVEIQLVNMEAAETVTLPAGFYACEILRVNTAGTTATDLSVWW